MGWASDAFLVDESFSICGERSFLGTEVAILKCSCHYWAHKSCAAKALVAIDTCPICRISTTLLDDEKFCAAFAIGWYHRDSVPKHLCRVRG